MTLQQIHFKTLLLAERLFPQSASGAVGSYETREDMMQAGSETLNEYILNGYLQVHSLHCRDANCPISCSQNLLPPVITFYRFASHSKTLTHFRARHFLVHDFLASLKVLTEAKIHYRNIVTALIILEIAGNAFKAFKLIQSITIDGDDLNLPTEFLVYACKRDILEFVYLRNKKIEKKYDLKDNVHQAVEFDQRNHDLKRTYMKSTKLRCRFWEELIVEGPNLNRIHDLGLEMQEMNLKIRKKMGKA